MDYCELLGIERFTDSLDEIKKAYRKQVRYYHPDKGNVEKGIAIQRTQELNEAYSDLRNADRKAAYDLTLQETGHEKPKRRKRKPQEKPQPEPQEKPATEFDRAGWAYEAFTELKRGPHYEHRPAEEPAEPGYEGSTFLIHQKSKHYGTWTPMQSSTRPMKGGKRGPDLSQRKRPLTQLGVDFNG